MDNLAKDKNIQETCEVCKKVSTKFCSACNKVFYCSQEHQRTHWKTHKAFCYPAELKTDENLGRCFVASRNIKPGELIFKDKALISGPSASELYFHPICLGCYQVVSGSYNCSKCKWPVCNEKCEKMSHHAEFECKIFAENKVLPCFTKSHEYDYINFLRTLLLKIKDESKWAEIAQLASHSESRARNQLASQALITTVDFLMSKCQLTEFDFSTIDHVLGVWGINSFGANVPSNSAYPNPKHRLATLLFPKLCLAAHNCIPNTRGILIEDPKALKPTYTMQLIAVVPIKTGEQIHTTYTNVSEGTYERRKVLRDNYYFQCNCKRCSDATELGTYFSAIKCSCLSKDSQSHAYFLPKNCLDFDSPWICNNCCQQRSYKELSFPLFEKIKCEINSVGNEANFQSINQLEKILMSHQDRTLHRNHWLMLEVEYRLLHRITGFLPKACGKNEESLVQRIVCLAEHILKVANVIFPGQTTYRGKILYCLCQAKLQEVIRLAQGIGGLLQSDKIMSLKKIAEEAKDILGREPEGSEDKTISKLLNDDLKQIDKLDGLMKLQINATIFS